MAGFKLPYGNDQTLPCDVPEANLLSVLQGLGVPKISLEAAFADAWENPIGMSDPVCALSSGDRIVLVVTDHTRPTPTSRLLPLVLESLSPIVRRDDVTILVATGTHRPPTEDELQWMLGDLRHEFRVCIHDCDRDLVDVGTTSRGTRVLLNRLVVEADHVITVGHIGMHYYAGYSGGRKNLLPGVAGRATIEANHAMLSEPLSKACVYHGNPISEEMVEAARMVRHAFIVDVVLDAESEVAKVCIGEPEAAHAEGRAYWDAHFQVPLSRKADIVLASAGGHPKDINLYQAYKGLYNGARAVRDGGLLYLAAACPDGIGHPTFTDWVERGAAPDGVLQILATEGFKLGGHKAVYLAHDRKRVQLFLTSGLAPNQARRFFFTPVSGPNDVLNEARRRYGEEYRVIVMPHAGDTFPVET